MAPRAHWKGYLKLSLVSCAVAMFTATSTSERVHFNMLNRSTGHRLKQQYVDAVSGDVVEPDERVRGYQVAKEDYVVVEDEEIDTIALESTHTILIDRFVLRSEIDTLYFDDSWFLAPDDRVAVEAFSVIREAMRRSGKVGLARVVLNRRERILMLEPRGRGLVATGLRYASEVRSPDTIFADIPEVAIDDELVGLASHIIETKTGPFDPSAFEDRYESALVDLVRSKRAGRPAHPSAPVSTPSNVVNLVDALRRSLEAEGAAAPAKPRGKGPPKPQGKAPARPTGRHRKAG